MAVAKKFEKVAVRAYNEILRLQKRHGSGVMASMAARTDANVPDAMRGTFHITGADKLHTATNLASAMVTFKSVRNTKTVWLVEDGKRTRVLWK